MDKDTMRAATRPIILILLNIVAATIILIGLSGDFVSSGFWVEWADKWLWFTFGFDAEWIFERPLIKIFSGMQLTKK